MKANRPLLSRATLPSLLSALCLSCFATVASAQVTPFATESFDYPVPGLFHGMPGGTGWSNNWFVFGMANDDMVMFDNNFAPAFPLSDGIGGHAAQASAFGPGFRQFDLAAIPDLINPATNMIGRDGTTVWVSFSTQLYQGQPFEHYGGISLWKAGGAVPEAIFLGSPWNSQGWGIDDEGNNGNPSVFVPGSDNTVAARLVYRFDFMPGNDRCRMWIDPAVPYPQTPPDLDEDINDLGFDEIRMESGGNNGDFFFWDNLEFAKGTPDGTLGMNYCMPAANSTGAAANIRAVGTTLVVDNNFELMATSMPTTAFGFFIVSQTQAFVTMPGGSSGNLCLGGSVGRYVGPGQIQNSGTAGEISLDVDLTMVPQPNGFVSVLPGQAWNFQAWYRDSSPAGPTSNFTNGLEVTFQ